MKAIVALLAFGFVGLADCSRGLADDLPAVTLHLKNEPPKSAFEKLLAGTSLKALPLEPKLWEKLAGKPVTIDLQDGSFWDALAELNRATGLWIAQGTGNAVLVVVDNGAALRRPSAISGPLRISALSADSDSVLDFDNTKIVARDSYKVRLLVEADPRYHATSLERAEDAEPERGGRGQPNPATLIGFSAGRAILNMNAASQGKGLARVQGKYLLAHVAHTEPIELAISDETKPVAQDFGDIQATLSLHPIGGGYLVEMSIQNAHLSPRQWSRLAVAMNSSVPTLDDAAESYYILDPGRGSIPGGDRILRAVQIHETGLGKKLPAAMKLKWNVPVKIDSEPTTIELKDMPLP